VWPTRAAKGLEEGIGWVFAIDVKEGGFIIDNP
jgi:hypothetical protein